MKKPILFRGLFYAAGLLILALGLTLNTKTGLGVSPIISVAYSISVISGHNFGNMTLALYSVFVLIEMVLHLNRDRNYTKNSGGALAHAGKTDRKLILLMDFLQIPLSLVFTSVFRPAEYGRRDGASGSCPDPCHYTDRNRRGHVAEYADRPESGGRNRTGDCRHHS